MIFQVSGELYQVLILQKSNLIFFFIFEFFLVRKSKNAILKEFLTIKSNFADPHNQNYKLITNTKEPPETT